MRPASASTGSGHQTGAPSSSRSRGAGSRTRRPGSGGRPRGTPRRRTTAPRPTTAVSRAAPRIAGCRGGLSGAVSSAMGQSHPPPTVTALREAAGERHRHGADAVRECGERGLTWIASWSCSVRIRSTSNTTRLIVPVNADGDRSAWWSRPVNSHARVGESGPDPASVRLTTPAKEGRRSGRTERSTWSATMTPSLVSRIWGHLLLRPPRPPHPTWMNWRTGRFSGSFEANVVAGSR